MIARMAVIMLALLGLGGCYRMTKPPQLGEDVRVVVKTNDARLVRAQAHLHNAVAHALESRLGWTVSPSGSAKLELFLDQEEIKSTGTTSQNIPARFSIRLHGDALLTSHHPPITHGFSGVGNASTISQEVDALEQASDNAAASIATWLETAGKNWNKPEAAKTAESGN